MNTELSNRFHQLINFNVNNAEPIFFDSTVARKLCNRIEGIRLHTHSYSFIHNMTHGSFKPADVLEFAYQNELHGLNIHVDDGGEHGLSHSTPKELVQFKNYAQRLNLAVHLEISNTQRADVDRVIQLARQLGVGNIRVYSRYEGTLSRVLAQTVADLKYMAEQADRYDLYFDFEQHEEIKSAEIVQMIEEVDHPRINALFDFTNMINAYETPLSALRTMAPYIRQVHLKGAKILKEEKGYGQVGAVQGSAADEMPYARMLYELLMLGETKPQVICFVLEQEANYYSPAYRHSDEGENPFIPYKDPSETPFDEKDADWVLLNERRWASNQVFFIKNLLAEMLCLASLASQYQ